ncbi:hypothetical protein I306_05198 [Cryptococcus gattii EJB2]|uniref:Uncharacterized protein n=1 Tax=Cryptococcus gattii EJB2 TaxID=1296103 RepID=A0ABR5BQ77_9TREE|nr:hypothetical protein I306_05198 [Cryptococcus gattii EJB2]
MPPSQQPPHTASTLSHPATCLAVTAAAANAISATPLREGCILHGISQIEIRSPLNNLPASPAVSLPSNSSAVAPQQPASPSPAPSAQDKTKNKATGKKSKPANSSQQCKPRFQWTRGSNIVDGLHLEGHSADWMGIYENWKVYSTLIAEKRPQFCEEHVIPYFTEVGISCIGLSPSAIVGRIADLQKLFQDADALQKPNQHTGESVTEEDIAKGIDTWDSDASTPALLQQAISNKEAEELGESDLSMMTNCLMSEDIFTADEGGDCVEDGKEADDILSILGLAGKGSAANAKKLAKELKGKSKPQCNEAFHKKGRMELAAFQAEAAAMARAEEREEREARWKVEDERDSLVKAMEMKRMQAESA